MRFSSLRPQRVDRDDDGEREWQKPWGAEAARTIKIHVELITDWNESTTTEVCEFSRPIKEFSAETVRLSLDDGKKMLQIAQQQVVSAQT